MNARAFAYRLLVDWERKHPHADDLLHERLDLTPAAPRDRALVMELFYGVLRRISTLDFFIEKLREGSLDDETRMALRLGLYQLYYTRIPAFAAVKETVFLSRRAGGLVNAILRRADRERSVLIAALEAAPDEVRWSHPAFLLKKWMAYFGSEAVAKLAEWNNQPPPVIVRANTLKTTREDLLAALPGATPHPFHPLAITVPHIPADWIQNGLCYVQDPSTLAACEMLAPEPGEKILDACAAPGGKTTALAAMMGNKGRLIAADLWESRVARLRENCQRLGILNAEPLVLDTMKDAPELTLHSFDRVLIDAPCSNTGVIRRRMDVRWRLTDEDFVRMPTQQLALIRRCAALLRPGGILVYSTCSLEPEENEQVIAEAMKSISGLQTLEMRHVRPWVDGVDGAFVAKMVVSAV